MFKAQVESFYCNLVSVFISIGTSSDTYTNAKCIITVAVSVITIAFTQVIWTWKVKPDF